MALLNEIGLSVSRKGFNFSSTRQEDPLEMSWGPLRGAVSFFHSLWDLDAWEVRLEVLKFIYFAPDVLRDPAEEDGDSMFDSDIPEPPRFLGGRKQPVDEASLQSYLRKHKYSDKFTFSYLVPLLSIFWNIGDIQGVLDLPLETTLKFLWDNDLLKPHLAWPFWATLRHETDFSEAMAKILPHDKIHVATLIIALKTRPQEYKSERGVRKDRFILIKRDGQSEEFDHVIFAIPPDEAIRVLGGEATIHENLVLSGYIPTKALTILHSDTSVSCTLLLFLAFYNRN